MSFLRIIDGIDNHRPLNFLFFYFYWILNMSYIFLLWFIISYLDDEEAGNVFINISLWISNNKTYYPRGVNVFATSFLSYQYIHNIYIL